MLRMDQFRVYLAPPLDTSLALLLEVCGVLLLLRAMGFQPLAVVICLATVEKGRTSVPSSRPVTTHNWSCAKPTTGRIERRNRDADTISVTFGLRSYSLALSSRRPLCSSQSFFPARLIP